ncbi:MAG: PQQ-like beta-propeller repeat protein, partial [Acidobacteria bacterium]|nr:PQQ-like beta-propeller repeat protein [Acidobacteriota bacterium]
MRARVPTTSCVLAPQCAHPARWGPRALAFFASCFFVCSGFCPDSRVAAQATDRQRYDAIVRSFRETVEKPLPPPLLPAETAWSLKLGAPPSAPAVMDDRYVYIPLRDHLLVALHRETGILAWTWAGDTVLSLATGGGDLFLVTADGLRAVDAASGYERWSIAVDGRVTAPLLWHEGWLIASVEPGDLLALRALDGRLVWRRPLGATTVHPAAAGGPAVYVTLADGRVAAMALDTGEPLWEQRLPGTLSPPAAARGRVFVGSTDNFFYALDAGTGREEWKWRNGGDVIGAAVDGETVYF